ILTVGTAISHWISSTITRCWPTAPAIDGRGTDSLKPAYCVCRSSVFMEGERSPVENPSNFGPGLRSCDSARRAGQVNTRLQVIAMRRPVAWRKPSHVHPSLYLQFPSL